MTKPTPTDATTPRPWKVSGLRTFTSITSDSPSILDRKFIGDLMGENGEANAALIVRSVNLHDDLVKVIQGIYDYAKLCKGTDAERIQYLAKQGLDKISG